MSTAIVETVADYLEPHLFVCSCPFCGLFNWMDSWNSDRIRQCEHLAEWEFFQEPGPPSLPFGIFGVFTDVPLKQEPDWYECDDSVFEGSGR